uniref:Uncharacterized protein n=1 Tax=Osmundaria fimbriata TaxID=228265 RepID=A0A1Z1M477_OSMFI|nr:hypothetical protein [Osmundaria fimbriata]ARW60868.1 hypothetical protein [Osmundaria fimbriata]
MHLIFKFVYYFYLLILVLRFFCSVITILVFYLCIAIFSYNFK